MRFLTIAVLLLAALYSGYWYVGSAAVERGALAATEQLRAEGWDITFDSLETRGFPSRFDTTAENLSLVSPSGAFGWDVPFAQVFALSYQPTKVIAAAAPTQTLRLDGTPFGLETEGMRASARFGASADLPLQEAILDLAKTSLTAPDGTRIDIATLLAAVRTQPGSETALDLVLEVGDLTLLDTLPLLQLRADLGVALSAPLDRTALFGAAPDVEVIDIRVAQLTWEDTRIQLGGQLLPQVSGQFEGTLAVRIHNWPSVLGALETAGMLTEADLPQVREMIAPLSPDGTSLETVLTISDGLIRLGPMILGAFR
jgi:hypothetical protein